MNLGEIQRNLEIKMRTLISQMIELRLKSINERLRNIEKNYVKQTGQTNDNMKDVIEYETNTGNVITEIKVKVEELEIAVQQNTLDLSIIDKLLLEIEASIGALTEDVSGLGQDVEDIKRQLAELNPDYETLFNQLKEDLNAELQSYIDGIEDNVEAELDAYREEIEAYKNGKYYHLSHFLNGGTPHIEDYVKLENTSIERPTIEKPGHRLVGWFYDNLFTSPIAFPFNLIKNTEMHAQWKEIIYYTIYFDVDGGVEIEPMRVEQGTTIVLPTATKENCTFNGWYYDEACTQPVESHITVNSDMTFYAAWIEDVPAIIYASNLNTRFVRFRCSKTTNDWGVNFSEIEVYSNGENVALGKKARKSASDGSFVDTVATDGLFYHYRSGNTVPGTDGVPKNNWFTIDLEQGYNIDTIKFFGMDMVHNVNVMEDVELQISEDDNNWYFIDKSTLTFNKVTDDTQHIPKEYDLTSVVIRNPNKQYLNDIPVRYIKSKIANESRGYVYSVLEVEAFSNGVNVALGKPGRMRDEEYQAPSLVTNGEFHNTSCFTLNCFEWMTIDLQGLYKLDNIHYYCFDTYGENGSSFYWNDHEVLVSPDGENWYVAARGNVINVNKTAGWTRDYINYNLTTTEVVEKTILPLSTLNVQYIKDEQWGNNNGNNLANWNEIMAMKDGVNVAQGCSIIQSWDGRTYNNSTLTDGVIDNNVCGTETSGRRDNPRAITVILREPVKLDSVIINRSPTDITTGFYNRVLVSADAVTWYVLYDSDEDGVYSETATGREFTTYK